MNYLTQFEEGNIALEVSLLGTDLNELLELNYLINKDGNNAELDWTYLIKEDGKLKGVNSDYITYQIRVPYKEFIERHQGYFSINKEKILLKEKIGNGLLSIKGDITKILIFLDKHFKDVKVTNNLTYNDDPIILVKRKLMKTNVIPSIEIEYLEKQFA